MTRVGTSSRIAHCLDCDWICEDMLAITNHMAKMHAREEKHKTFVEKNVTYVYDGRVKK